MRIRSVQQPVTTWIYHTQKRCKDNFKVNLKLCCQTPSKPRKEARSILGSLHRTERRFNFSYKNRVSVYICLHKYHHFRLGLYSQFRDHGDMCRFRVFQILCHMGGLWVAMHCVTILKIPWKCHAEWLLSMKLRWDEGNSILCIF